MLARPKSYKRRKVLKVNSPKTTTKEGKNEYMKIYMRRRRKEMRRLPMSKQADFNALHNAIFQGVKHPEVRKAGRKKETLRIP